MKILSREEIQRFLIQAKAEGMYELFLLELTTGMRRGELLALQWSDLDFKSGRLRISRQVYPRLFGQRLDGLPVCGRHPGTEFDIFFHIVTSKA